MSDHTPPDLPSRHQPHDNPVLRWAFFIMGFVFVGLGIVGVIVPGMPTTVFILLAGYCWAKSSRRFHRWLLNHKIFGKMLKDWQERRAMPRFAKYLAWGMMSLSCVLMLFRLPDDKLWLGGVLSLLCLGVGIWMARLPDA
ncbi:MAG: YbaN family protein [Moraxella sp.]|nr:YbaN family protein [Moraxella sp.]